MPKALQWETDGSYFGKMDLDTIIALHQMLKDGGVLLYDKAISIEAKVFITYFTKPSDWVVKDGCFIKEDRFVSATYKGVKFTAIMTVDTINGAISELGGELSANSKSVLGTTD